jgi:hypothetical protein
MAKINNTSAYAISSPIDGSDIVIGSALGVGGDTKNFQMSDISTYVLGNAVTPTLDDVCQQGDSTTTGITVAGITTLNGVLDANSTADISGNTTIGGTLGVSQAATFSLGATINGAGLAVNGSGGILVTDAAGITSAGGPVSGTALSTSGGLLVSGTSLLGEIDSAGPADIADTLTLSKATGNGLDVVSDANIGGKLITNTIEADTGNLILNDSSSIERLRLTAAGGFVFQGTVSFAQAAPSSSTSTGSTGQIALDTNYIYVCVGTNSWGRIAIDTTPF